MDLIALAIAPGIAICLFIFHRDAYNREPKLNLIAAFAYGAVAIIPAFFIERALFPNFGNTISETAVTAFLVVAFTEEIVKFVSLRYYAMPKKSFDEPLDGIVYGVMIGMGFATIENVMYVLGAERAGNAYQVGFMRMFLAVPAHGTFGVLMGYFAGKAKFDKPNSTRLLLTGLFWAVFFHGAYDFFLFLQNNPYVRDYVSNGALFLGAVVSFGLAVRLSLKHIKIHRRLSQQTYHPTENMSIRKAFAHDIPLIRNLTGKIWPATYVPILGNEQVNYMLNLMYSEQALLEQMKKNEFVLIYDGVTPIGFASYGITEPGTCKLHKLYVLPEYQGKGTGSFAIEKLAVAMKSMGATNMLLNVNRHNSAKSFYEKIGFVVLKEEDIDIGNGYFMNDFVMQKSI